MSSSPSIPGLSQIRERSVLGIASLFLDREQVNVFKRCYAVMRQTDDIVDNRRALRTAISEQERRDLLRQVDHALMRGGRSDAEAAAFRALCEKYAVPEWPWEAWRRSMRYDLSNDGFRTYRDFLRYAEGAAVAPGALYLHICGMRKTAAGYVAAELDLKEASRPLALFCYHVHILRDLKEDCENGIFFFPDDLMRQFSLTRETLRQAWLTKRPPKEVCAIAAWYGERASRYRQQSRDMLDRVEPMLSKRAATSCEIIFTLYSAMHDRIDAKAGQFLGEDIKPSPRRVRTEIARVMMAHS